MLLLMASCSAVTNTAGVPKTKPSFTTLNSNSYQSLYHQIFQRPEPTRHDCHGVLPKHRLCTARRAAQQPRHVSRPQPDAPLTPHHPRTTAHYRCRAARHQPSRLRRPHHRHEKRPHRIHRLPNNVFTTENIRNLFDMEVEVPD